jgi:triacylglycerol lipase
MTPKQWALMAQAAYTAPPDLGPEDSAGRIVFNPTDDGLILAIPGTNNEQCALADIDAIPHDVGPCGLVHRGIWKAFDPVWLGVSQLSVHALVGHSEGATGALMLAGRLCSIGKAPKVVWAWEPARCSIDDKLEKLLAAHGVEVHIMIHGNDVVPDLPPTLPPLLDWRHPASVTRFGNAAYEIPNIADHMLNGIIADL